MYVALAMESECGLVSRHIQHVAHRENPCLADQPVSGLQCPVGEYAAITGYVRDRELLERAIEKELVGAGNGARPDAARRNRPIERVTRRLRDGDCRSGRRVFFL